MHRLHRVRFPVALPLHPGGQAAAGLLHSVGFRDFELESDFRDFRYLHPWIWMQVTQEALQERWLDVRDLVEPLGCISFPPYVLWHSKFARDGHRPQYYPRRARRRPEERARRRRELMLRDKQRILDRCSTTERD